MPIRKKYLHAKEAKELHSAIMKKSRYRNKFLKDKSQTSRQNYKTKKSYFESLNTKKSWMLEPSSKLLFLFSQKRRQKVKRLFLMKQKNIFLTIKKYRTFVLIFPKKPHIVSQLSLKRLKNTPALLTLEKGILIQYFHSERLLRSRYRKFSGI